RESDDACEIEWASPHLTLPLLRSGSLPLPACAQGCPGKMFAPFRRVRAKSCSTHHRHARPCAGHPRLFSSVDKTWMAGTSPAMTMKESLRQHIYNRISFPGQPCAFAGTTVEQVVCKSALLPALRLRAQRRIAREQSCAFGHRLDVVEHGDAGPLHAAEPRILVGQRAHHAV